MSNQNSLTFSAYNLRLSREMKSTFEIKFNEDQSFINHEIRGFIYMETLLHNLQTYFENRIYSDQFGVLIDIRFAEFPGFMERIKSFVDLFDTWSKKMNMKRKCAILTNTRMKLKLFLFSKIRWQSSVQVSWWIYSPLKSFE